MAVCFGQFFQCLYNRFTGSHCLARCLEPNGPVSVPRRHEHDSNFVIGNVYLHYNTYV